MTTDQQPKPNLTAIAATITSVIQEQLYPALRAAEDATRGRYSGGFRQANIEEVVLPALGTLLDLANKVASNLSAAEGSSLIADSALASLNNCFAYIQQLDYQRLADDKIYCGSQQFTIQAFTDLLRNESEFLKSLVALAQAKASCEKMRAHFAIASAKSSLVAVLKAKTEDELKSLPEHLSTLQLGYHYVVELKSATSVLIVQRGACVSFTYEEAEAFFEVFELPLLPTALTSSH